MKGIYVPRTERLAHFFRDGIDLQLFADPVDVLVTRLPRDSFFANGFASLGKLAIEKLIFCELSLSEVIVESVVQTQRMVWEFWN